MNDKSYTGKVFTYCSECAHKLRAPSVAVKGNYEMNKISYAVVKHGAVNHANVLDVHFVEGQH